MAAGAAAVARLPCFPFQFEIEYGGGWGASSMRFNQQDFRRRFGMNLFTVVAAFATIGWLWLLIQLADLLLHRHAVGSILR